MSLGTDSDYSEKLLIERIAEILGFAWLADRLPWNVYPPYLLVAVTLIIEYGVIDGYNFFVAGKVSVVSDPISIVTALGLILAVVGIRWMRDTYAEAMTQLHVSQHKSTGSAGHPITFEYIIAFRLKIAAYGVGLLLLFGNHFLLLGIPTLLEIQGVVSTILYNFTLQPLVYVPLIVEFGLLYVGIHFFLPRRMLKADLDLFFYDPRNMGGFAKVGELLKRSYYLYTAGLVLYVVLIYGVIFLNEYITSPYPEPSTALAVMFTALWLVGIVSIGYSMYRVHTLMSDKKAREIDKIENQIRGMLDDPYDIHNSNLAGDENLKEIQHRLEQVRATREYPSTFTMWTQIGISVLLPQALQLVVQFGS
jgi:uncharacterized membrane protein YciS (DUF1049 family)